MKNIAFFLILALSFSLAFAQKDSLKGNQFQLKGKLIGEIELPSGCGVSAWGMVLEFEILESSHPDYKLPSMGVIVCCPRMYGDKFFDIGQQYQMTIVDDEIETSRHWTIPNISVLDKYQYKKHLYVMDAKKVE